MNFTKAQLVIAQLDEIAPISEYEYIIDDNGYEYIVHEDGSVFDIDDLEEIFGDLEEAGASDLIRKAATLGHGAPALGTRLSMAAKDVTHKAGAAVGKGIELAKAHPHVAAGAAGAAALGLGAAALARRRSKLKKAGVTGKGGLKSQYKAGAMGKAQYKQAKAGALASLKNK